MKKFISILASFIVALILIGAIFVLYTLSYLKKEDAFKIITDEKGAISIEIREEEKSLLKSMAKKIGEFIYGKATKYNPEGDVLPDEIDNRIKEEIKAKVK